MSLKTQEFNFAHFQVIGIFPDIKIKKKKELPYCTLITFIKQVVLKSLLNSEIVLISLLYQINNMYRFSLQVFDV